MSYEPGRVELEFKGALGAHDVLMNNSVNEEEGEGEDVGPGDRTDDSSEEEEEDEAAAAEVRKGFIVDEEEEEEEGEDEDEDEEEERRRRKKRRKHKHKHKRREEEEEDLDEEDLELLEENTGGRIRSRHLTRLRRGRVSESADEDAGLERKGVIESSDDDLDESNIIGAREIQDIQNIWDDERAGIRDEDEDMDMDDFIDDEEELEEGAGAMAEEEREERRRERRRLEKERRKALRAHPELTGIDATAWDEIHDVFGDGHDYDWALADDEDELMVDEVVKPEMKYEDVFEPSEIKARLLTEDDDLIRARDIPERMQLATSTLSSSVSLITHEPFTSAECVDAASWVTPRLVLKERDYFKSDGRFHELLERLVEAVARALEFMLVENREVPYVFSHRRDLLSYFNPQDTRFPRVELLNQDDLWRIYDLGTKYRSLTQRSKALIKIFERLNVQDTYFEEHLKPNMDSVEAVADVTNWLGMKYKDRKKDTFEMEFHDDEDRLEVKKHKLPSRTSAYEMTKRSIVSRLAEGFGIKSHEIVVNFMTSPSGHNAHFVEDPDLPPIAFAEQFIDPNSRRALSPEDLLRQARMLIATELGADPLLRRHVREQFKNFAQVSVSPTEKGKQKIDEYHQYHNFKYLHNKSVTEMLRSLQFLNILAAEAELLVTVSITIPTDVKQLFVNQLVEAFASDSFSETAKAWNEERTMAIQEAVEKHLILVGTKWVREYIREEVEDYLAKCCGDAFYERINAAPYAPPGLEEGEQWSILAVSWGKGDPKRDEINLVFLDEAGRLREFTQIDNLTDQKNVEEFLDFINRRRPDVVVIGGFSIQTTKLSQQIKETLVPQRRIENSESIWGASENANEEVDASRKIPVIYVFDETARLYQHSRRAEDEFPHLNLISRYCVGLARYAQSPLNEYAALGRDIVAVTFDEVAQPLVPKEKLLIALERALVDVVNRVGVDINRAVNDSYHATLLPYVAGLGPRKAQALIKKITSIGGHLINRIQFVMQNVLTTCICYNAAGFLRISQDPDYRPPKSRGDNYSDSPDPLDDTRIHPQDYDLARKMATDALELDEEDVHDEHPSSVVSQLMKDRNKSKSLDELNLDDFAISMEQARGDRKRHTLNVIRAELIKPFGELRDRFILPQAWDVLTALTGETVRTLRVGLIVSVLVMRVVQNSYVVVRLDSGIEGVINAKYLSDIEGSTDSVRKGQTIPGVVIDVKMDLQIDQFFVELSSRPSDVQAGDGQFRRVKIDEHWNHAQAERDLDIQQRKKRAEVERTRRVIKHPNFQNLGSGQAEAYLDKQHAGEVVIRPSSKGPDHLAVTWKVADKLYQHIDVVEPNADPTGQSVGGQLIVDGKYEFADLDELIVNHVKAMSRRVEELMAHEKFKRDDDELQKFLMSFVAANPNKSIYGFTLNRKKPGHFNLSFLAKKGSSIQTWPVRVAPEAYYLFDAAAAGVSELCDAFKVRYLHESQNVAGAPGSGKTPYGAGRMTPARTPGHVSARQAPRTPNPYATPVLPPVPQPMAAAVPGGSSYGGPTYGAPGGWTPRPGYAPPPVPPTGGYPVQQPANVPPGMNPARAAMIQDMSGSAAWGSGGGGWR